MAPFPARAGPAHRNRGRDARTLFTCFHDHLHGDSPIATRTATRRLQLFCTVQMALVPYNLSPCPDISRTHFRKCLLIPKHGDTSEQESATRWQPSSVTARTGHYTHVKHCVRRSCEYQRREELEARFRTAGFETIKNTPTIFNDVLRNMLRRCRTCVEYGGDNFEQLLYSLRPNHRPVVISMRPAGHVRPADVLSLARAEPLIPRTPEATCRNAVRHSAPSEPSQLGNLSQDAVANQTLCPVPEPRAANQRVGTTTSKSPPRHCSSQVGGADSWAPGSQVRILARVYTRLTSVYSEYSGETAARVTVHTTVKTATTVSGESDREMQTLRPGACPRRQSEKAMKTGNMYSLDLPLEEVNADSFLVVLGEGAFAVSLDHAGLAHSAVTHDHHLQATHTHTHTEYSLTEYISAQWRDGSDGSCNVGLGTLYLTGCARILSMNGYCMLRKDLYWLGCRLGWYVAEDGSRCQLPKHRDKLVQEKLLCSSVLSSPCLPDCEKFSLRLMPGCANISDRRSNDPSSEPESSLILFL
ncbi:hypothetical protein PR048_020429, partial [Dryococelus australis]